MTLFEACLAKPYRWLGILHAWLVHVGKGTRVDGLELIALLIAIPVFEVRYLLFQLLYASQERRLRIACLKELEAPVHHGIKQGRSLFPHLGRGFERMNALRQINGYLEAVSSSRERHHINHPNPL